MMMQRIEKMDKPKIKIGVRNLVEFILQRGDLVLEGFGTSQRLQEGTRIHRKLQKEEGEEYKPEVRLSCQREYDSFILVVDGIADGILQWEGDVTIDEIKTVTIPLSLIHEDFNHLHWAQAKCYAYMVGMEKGLDRIRVRLTYYNVDTEEKKAFCKAYSFSELEEFCRDLFDAYASWGDFLVCHQRERNRSMKEIQFPFPAYRRGQREMAAAVYLSIRDKRTLFAQAPTGTGKTISTLFPAVKAMGEGMGDRIFYLTAKTVARQVAEGAVSLMEEKGLVIKSITLTAKDKVCPYEDGKCNPEDCSRAQGHFDRVNDAVMDILMQETVMTRDVVEAYAEKHRVCPFEFSLDTAMWVDCIICDYNYVFDPRVSLKRFFEEGGDYLLLVDEAHNLVDRAREMFSAELSKRAFLDQRQKLKSTAPKAYRALMDINKYFIELRKSFEKKKDSRIIEPPEALYHLAAIFVEEWEGFLAQSRGQGVDDALMELYFNCLSFLTVYRLYDERYVTYAVREDSDVTLKLFCVDPSFLLRRTYSRGRATVFFSATLLPLKYFRDMLGGQEEDGAIRLPSPFDPGNLQVMAARVSTRYRDRERNYPLVARYIKGAVQQRTGNYFVFFPSYEYMGNVYSLYRETWPQDRVVIQESGMSEGEREDFLSIFTDDPDQTLVAFAVMGGIFSEGIDLTGDRLSGAIIVGVGLPQISMEREVIHGYFREKTGDGYPYAYMLPGMNRVLQAAGRVIRTEEDRGFILLLDDRFLHRRYLELFPREWAGYARVRTPEEVERTLQLFWHRD